MGHATTLSAPALEQFLHQALHTRAVASLRLQSAKSRLVGDLRIHAFRSGADLELAGLRTRESVPPEGMPVTLTILLGEEVLTLESTIRATRRENPSETILCLGWPVEPARLHPRREVRVAAPDQSPLKVQVSFGGRSFDALLVNLTETGVGLALSETLMVDLHTEVQIDAELPDGAELHCPGEVRHLTFRDGLAFPTRLGVVLRPSNHADLEPIHRFIQTRRTDRSQGFRQG